MHLPEKTSPGITHILAALLIAAFVILAGMSLNTSIYYSPDGPNYLNWAKSLASFEGFKLTYGPEPSRYVINAPLYPILLAPVAFFFPMDVIAAKVLTLGLAVLLLILFYRFTYATAGAAAALIGLMLLAANPQMMIFSTQILSDVPFGLSLILVLIVVRRLTIERRPPAWLPWTLPVLLSCAVLLRVIGFALLAAVVLFFALRKEYARAGWAFLVPLLVYMVWHIRNDIVVARAELPQMQNTALFFGHFLTSDAEGMLTEFAARVRHSIEFYTLPAGSTLILPQYVGWLFAVVDFRDPRLAAVQSVADNIQWPVVIVTFAVSAYGLKVMHKTDSVIRLIILFLIFYAGIMLFYPINDTRYLFPVLLIMAYAAAVALREALKRLQGILGEFQYSVLVGCGVLVLLLLYPNIVWTRNFLATAIEFRRAPEQLYEEIRNQQRYPIEYTKLFPQAGAWLTEHGAASGVVLCRYREAALWLTGRKVVAPDPLIAPGDFDVLLRDDGCAYVMAHMAAHQLRDFEFQMAVSAHFRFEPVFRAGDVEVLQVCPQVDSAGPPQVPVWQDTGAVIRGQMLRGIRLIESQDYTTAKAIFDHLKKVDGYEESGTFYAAIAEEFSLHLDEARQLFRDFRSMPLATTFLRQAQIHQNIVDMLDSAAHAPPGEEQASFYHSVSLSYWLLGFRPQAEAIMDKCMAADSTYFIGPLFAALYALEQGDITAAQTYAERAQHLRPRDRLSTSLLNLVAAARQRASAFTPAGKASLDISMAREFVTMGLTDFAIWPLTEAARLDTTNVEVLQLLSQLYIQKDRKYPAQKVLERLLALDPSSESARVALRKISNH